MCTVKPGRMAANAETGQMWGAGGRGLFNDVFLHLTGGTPSLT
jgi:hypothetical protein